MIHRIFKLSVQGVDANVYDCCRATSFLLIFWRCMLTCKYTYIKVQLCPKLYFLGVFKKKKKKLNSKTRLLGLC